MLEKTANSVKTSGSLTPVYFTVNKMASEFTSAEEAWRIQEEEEGYEELPDYYLEREARNIGKNTTSQQKKTQPDSKKFFEQNEEYDSLVVTGFRKNINNGSEVRAILDTVVKLCNASLYDDYWEVIRMERETENYGVVVKIEPVAKRYSYSQYPLPQFNRQENGLTITPMYSVTFTTANKWEKVHQRVAPKSFVVVRGIAGSRFEIAARMFNLNEWVNQHFKSEALVIYGNVSQVVTFKDPEEKYQDDESVAFIFGAFTQEEERKLDRLTDRKSFKPGFARCGCFQFEFYSSVGQIIHFQFLSIRMLRQMAVFEVKRIDEAMAMGDVFRKIMELFPKVAWIYPEKKGADKIYVVIFSDGGPQGERNLSSLKYNESSEMPTMVHTGYTRGIANLIERRKRRIDRSLKISPWIEKFQEEMDGLTTSKTGRIIRTWAETVGLSKKTGTTQGSATGRTFARSAPSTASYQKASAKEASEFEDDSMRHPESESDDEDTTMCCDGWETLPTKASTIKAGAIAGAGSSSGHSRVPPILRGIAKSLGEVAKEKMPAVPPATANGGRGAFAKTFNPPTVKKDTPAMGEDSPSELTLSTKNTRLEAELRAAFERLKASEAQLAVERYMRTEAEEKIAALQVELDQQKEERRADNARMLKMEQQMQFLMQVHAGAQQISLPSPAPVVRGPIEQDELEEGEDEKPTTSESPKKRHATCHEADIPGITPVPFATPANVSFAASLPEPKGRTKALARRQRKPANIPFPVAGMHVEEGSLPMPSGLQNRFAALAALAEEREQPEEILHAADVAMEMETSLPAALEEVTIADAAGANRPASCEEVQDPSAHSQVADTSMEVETFPHVVVDEVDVTEPTGGSLQSIFENMLQPFDLTRSLIPYHLNGVDKENFEIAEYMTQAEDEAYITDPIVNPYQIHVKCSKDLGLDGAGCYSVRLGMGAYAAANIPVGSKIYFDSSPINEAEYSERLVQRATGYVMCTGTIFHDAAEARARGEIASAINNATNVWSTYWNRPARNHCTLSYSPNKKRFFYTVVNAVQEGEEIYAAYSSNYSMKRHNEDVRPVQPVVIQRPFAKEAIANFKRIIDDLYVGVKDMRVSVYIDTEAREFLDELMMAVYLHDTERARFFLTTYGKFKLQLTRHGDVPAAKHITKCGLCGVDSAFYTYCQQAKVDWNADWNKRLSPLRHYMDHVCTSLETHEVVQSMPKEDQLRIVSQIQMIVQALQAESPSLESPDWLPNWLITLFSLNATLTLWAPVSSNALELVAHRGKLLPALSLGQIAELSTLQHSIKLIKGHFTPFRSPSLASFPDVLSTIIKALFARYVCRATPGI